MRLKHHQTILTGQKQEFSTTNAAPFIRLEQASWWQLTVTWGVRKEREKWPFIGFNLQPRGRRCKLLLTIKGQRLRRGKLQLCPEAQTVFKAHEKQFRNLDLADRSKDIANRNYRRFPKIIKTKILFSGHGLLGADSAEFRKMQSNLIYSGVAVIWINAWNAEGISLEKSPNHFL